MARVIIGGLKNYDNILLDFIEIKITLLYFLSSTSHLLTFNHMHQLALQAIHIQGTNKPVTCTLGIHTRPQMALHSSRVSRELALPTQPR